MTKFLKALVAVLTTILCVSPAFAQVTTSSVSGIVTDDSGAPLEGSVIVAVHTPTGSQYYAVANSAGQYFINGMRAGGPYEIEVSFLGMETLRYTDITLKLGETYEINASLKATNELDAVVVVSESSFNASKTGAGSSFSLRQVEQMPSISKSVLDIVKFTPQAASSKQGGMSIGGASPRYNSFQIDGAVANDSFGLSSDGMNGANVGANPVSLDAIEEIQVVVAPFDVRQSGFTGGGINAITKSGTNKVKGTFYTRYYNQDFIGTTPGTTDLSDPFALSSLEPVLDAEGNKTGVGRRTKYDQQVTETYGFTVGAPIVKNKLFIFLSAEYYNNTQPNIYSPVAGSYEDQDSRKLSTPITINGVDHDYLDPVVAQEAIDIYMKYYTNNGLDINGVKVVEDFQLQKVHKNSLNTLARIDWNINESNKLMLRYQLLSANSESRAQGAKTYYFNNSSYDRVNTTHSLVAELNSRPADNISNEFRATAVLVDESRSTPYAAPTIYTTGDNTVLDLGTHYCSYINKILTNTYTLTDNLTVALGNHTITAGTHNELYSFANAYRTYATGQFNFSAMADYFAQTPGNITASEYRYNYADPTVEGVTGPDWYATTYALQLGFYLQDEWKPSRDFTLTYGIRADVPMLLNKPTANPEYNANAATYSTDPSEQVGIIPDAKLLWSPRIGFRWFADEEHKTLFRGGVGLFTGRVPFVWLSNAYNNTGMETKSVKITDRNMLDLLPITMDPYNDIVLGNKFTWYKDEASGKTVSKENAFDSNGNLKEGIVAVKGVQGSGAGQTINTLSKNFKYPQVFRANIGIDQEFDGGWKLTLDALFSKTFNNIYFRNIALEQKGTLLPVGKSNIDVAAPVYGAKTSDYSTIISLGNTNKGYSYSLSAKIDKHFEFGLDLMASYTYGHSYSCNDGLSSQAASNLSTLKSVDINNPELSYSIFDQPHKINAVAMYTSPTYAGGLMRTSVSLTYSGTSGQRYSYLFYDTADMDINGDGIALNTLLYIPTEDEVLSMQWSDKNSDPVLFEEFIQTDKYLRTHRGQWSERNAGISPFEHHFDMQIAQDIFYDKEGKRKLQVTFDVVNLSNMLNRNWGLYYSNTLYRAPLTLVGKTSDASGNVVPKFSFREDNVIYLSDFSSRWRCQLGVKLTF